MSSNQYIFASALLIALGKLQIDSAKLQVQTEIMHQNLAEILRLNQFYSIGPLIGSNRRLTGFGSGRVSISGGGPIFWSAKNFFISDVVWIPVNSSSCFTMLAVS